jgi:hypothetical protein
MRVRLTATGDILRGPARELAVYLRNGTATLVEGPAWAARLAPAETAWPLKTKPAAYLERYPNGPYADLARALTATEE